MFLQRKAQACIGQLPTSAHVTSIRRLPTSTRTTRCMSAQPENLGSTRGLLSQRSVFQAEPPRGSHHTMLDVRDAVEACSSPRTPEEREQCFLNFGLSVHAVDQYYDTVIEMEEAMEDPVSEEDALAQRLRRLGCFFLGLLICVRLL